MPNYIKFVAVELNFFYNNVFTFLSTNIIVFTLIELKQFLLIFESYFKNGWQTFIFYQQYIYVHVMAVADMQEMFLHSTITIIYYITNIIYVLEFKLKF